MTCLGNAKQLHTDWLSQFGEKVTLDNPALELVAFQHHVGLLSGIFYAMSFMNCVWMSKCLPVKCLMNATLNLKHLSERE